MRINQIQNFNYYNNNTIKAHSFKGLWGANSRLIDKDPVLGVYTDYETYYYYPYADETDEHIQAATKDYTKAYIDESQDSRYIVKECKICLPLPFTEDQYNEYKRAGLDTEITPDILKTHTFVQNKYLNNIGEQVSAVNSQLKPKLFRAII